MLRAPRTLLPGTAGAARADCLQPLTGGRWWWWCWTRTPADSSLIIPDSLADLRETAPGELYDLVTHIVDQPVIEDLDI